MGCVCERAALVPDGVKTGIKLFEIYVNDTMDPSAENRIVTGSAISTQRKMWFIGKDCEIHYL